MSGKNFEFICYSSRGEVGDLLCLLIIKFEVDSDVIMWFVLYFLNKK